MGFNQFSRSLFNWQSMIVLVLLGKIAVTNLIKTVITSQKNLKNLYSQIGAFGKILSHLL